MDNENAKIVFHITGGNNQILPQATHAEQHFYGDQFAPHPIAAGIPEASTPDDHLVALSIYIPEATDRSQFIQQLRVCTTASDVARIAVQMVERVPGLTTDVVKTQGFIALLQQLSPGVLKGRTTSNYRKAIENAIFTRRD